jgi:ketosteroid isomerase-like protein
MANRAVAERYFEAVSKGDIAGALACFSPDAEFIGPMGKLPFPNGVQAYFQTFERSFPGARFEVTKAIESGDDVVLEGTWIGRHTGPLQLPDGTTLPATNREVRGPFATLFTMRENTIVNHRGYWDMAGFMAQLG